MRLGELAQIIRRVTNSAGQIVIANSSLYADQAYVITNYAAVIEALKLLDEQKWNTASFSQIETLIDGYGEEDMVVQMETSEFSILNAYVNEVNAKLPIFLSMIDSVVATQDERVINVRLPDKIHTLAALNTQNARLNKLFKEFTIDGEVKLEGFDKGSDWYVILLTGTTTLPLFIGCLKVAQEFFKAKTEYYKSEQAKLDYKAAVKVYDQQYDEDTFERYKEERMEQEVEDQVEHLLKQVKPEPNGHGQAELQTKLVRATKDLVKELGNGTEFHLSLNPPSFAGEDGGNLTIDYKQIRKITTGSTKPKPTIEAKSSAPSDGPSE